MYFRKMKNRIYVIFRMCVIIFFIFFFSFFLYRIMSLFISYRWYTYLEKKWPDLTHRLIIKEKKTTKKINEWLCSFLLAVNAEMYKKLYEKKKDYVCLDFTFIYF